MKRIIIIAVVLAALAAVGGYLYTGNKSFDPKDYVVEKAHVGDITSSVSATGVLQAKVTVLVGTEVSGTIRKILVDHNYPVKKGEVLVKLDQELFKTQVDQARANVMNAKAKLQEMESNRGMTSSGVVTSIDQAKANLAKAEADYKRDQILIKTGSTSQQELDTTRQTYTVDKSQYEEALAEKDKNAVLDAQIAEARAAVDQAQANLQTAETNLSKTVITSPMDGVVIDRTVEVGQTVAASFSTPNLLTIGDLFIMQVAISIDEADVGQAKVGQKTTFTVDAFPDHIFKGTLSQIYYAPITVQNVVTYTGIIEIKNEKGLLRPGMTANIKIITGEKKGAILIPSSALRVKIPGAKDKKAGKDKGRRGKTIWVMQKDGPKAVQVVTGMTDLTNTEVVSGLKEGDPVVTDYIGQTKSGDSSQGGGGHPGGGMRM
jgi:HlyD family secretion protein